MKLWEPELCCCCCSRRTGCIIIGVLYMLAGILNLYVSITGLVTGVPQKDQELCLNFEDPSSCSETDETAHLAGYITLLLVGSLQIIFSSLLLHGVLKQKTRFLIPLMVMYLIQIILLLIMALIRVGLLIYLGFWIPVLINVAVLGSILFLEVYMLLVVRAYYLDIKRNKGRTHMSLNEQGYEPPPYSDPSKPPSAY